KRVEYRTKLSSLERLRQYGRLYGPYGESRCQFLTSNTREVWSSLDEEDKKDFNFDISQLDWSHYIKEVHIPGIKRYLLGMMEETPGKRQRLPVAARPEAVSAGEEDTGVSSLSDFLLTEVPGSEDLERWTRAGLFGRAFGKMVWPPIVFGMRYWVGLESHGRENVPVEGPFIVVANHSSHLDAPAVLVALGDRAKDLYPAAATDYFFENPLLGGFVHSAFRAIPFDRDGPMTDGLTLPLGILKMGHSLLFFPEGGRSKSGEIQPFKGGIALLGLISGAPVVPTYIQGTYESMPKGSSFPKRHKVTVRFGPPIPSEPYRSRLGRANLAELCRIFSSDVQKAVEALNGKG
ncbi:MAG: 1-acyl-sn-glycerol-3-phosphate acyltransferase, partial [Dehalococcoidia bacterium]